MELIAFILVAAVCIAALRITIDEQIEAHEEIVRDAENEKY